MKQTNKQTKSVLQQIKWRSSGSVGSVESSNHKTASLSPTCIQNPT